MVKSVKIGPFEFQNTWVFHKSRFRLIPAVVNGKGYVPVITMRNRRSVCRLPAEFAGRSVGVLNTSATSVFDLKTHQLNCYIFDPAFSPRGSRAYTEPKQAARRSAFVFGNDPYATDIQTNERSTIAGFVARNPDTHNIDSPDYLRKVNLEKKIFGFGFGFRSSTLGLNGLDHEKTKTHFEVLDTRFKELFKDVFTKMGADDLSFATLIFGFDGLFKYSFWKMRLGNEIAPIRTDIFPFNWDDLISKPVP